MGKRQKAKRKGGCLVAFLVVVLLVLAGVVGAMLFFLTRPDAREQTPTEPAAVDTTGPQEQTQSADPQASTDAQPTETVPVVTELPPTEPMEIVERTEASYERWLAAGTIVAVSMQYPDFQLDGIYLTGETDMSNKSASNGVYVLFTAYGEQLAAHTTPLAAERSGSGTIDLYTMDLGFAAFDVVSASGVDTAALQQVELEELEELISQSLLVSLYEH